MLHRLLLFIGTLLAAQVAKAQIAGGVGVMPGDNGDAIDAEVMKELTRTTTIFFYREGDAAQLEQWRAALAQVWTVTPVELHPYSERPNYSADMEKAGGPYSFLMFIAQTTQQRFRNLTVDLVLWVPSAKEHWFAGEKSKRHEFGRVAMDTDLPMLEYWSKHNSGEGIYPYPYGSAQLHTWTPELVAKMLQPINTALTEKVNRMARPFVNKDQIETVLGNTLWFCDYSLEQWDYDMDKPFLAAKQKDLLKDFEHKHKVVSVEELSTRLASGEGTIYFVITARQGTSTQLWVQRSDNGEVVYSAGSDLASPEGVIKALGKGKLP